MHTSGACRRCAQVIAVEHSSSNFLQVSLFSMTPGIHILWLPCTNCCSETICCIAEKAMHGPTDGAVREVIWLTALHCGAAWNGVVAGAATGLVLGWKCELISHQSPCMFSLALSIIAWCTLQNIGAFPVCLSSALPKPKAHENRGSHRSGRWKQH